jgi:exosortase
MKIRIQYFIIILLTLFIFQPIMYPLYFRFTAVDSYYSHGFLIPFLTLYLIWRKKNILRTLPVKPSIIGLYITLLSLLMHFAGYLIEFNFLSYMAFFLYIFGIVLYLFGKIITKALFAPLFFLIFMFPLPHVMIIGITFKMKMIAAYLANFIINQMGLKTSLVGSKIFYPGGVLTVEDPCSGLRSLISFIALGAVLMQLIQSPVWKKLVLFTSVIPIALLSNIVRVILLVYGCFIYGTEKVSGLVHDSIGMLVFVIGFILLIFVIGMLKCSISQET